MTDRDYKGYTYQCKLDWRTCWLLRKHICIDPDGKVTEIPFVKTHRMKRVPFKMWVDLGRPMIDPEFPFTEPELKEIWKMYNPKPYDEKKKSMYTLGRGLRVIFNIRKMNGCHEMCKSAKVFMHDDCVCYQQFLECSEAYRERDEKISEAITRQA